LLQGLSMFARRFSDARTCRDCAVSGEGRQKTSTPDTKGLATLYQVLSEDPPSPPQAFKAHHVGPSRVKAHQSHTPCAGIPAVIPEPSSPDRNKNPLWSLMGALQIALFNVSKLPLVVASLTTSPPTRLLAPPPRARAPRFDPTVSPLKRPHAPPDNASEPQDQAAVVRN
jgi:hypothetical protein